MAKRKRLTPANPAFLGGPPPPVSMRAPIAEVARDAAGSAAFDELAQELSEAREAGRMVVRVPLKSVQLDYLVRDRLVAGSEDLEALEASIEARGQQTPVDLVDLGGGQYGLISGWRRIRALSALFERTGDTRFAEVLGLLRRPSDSAASYLAMVEENEIRVGLSYFERARIVIKAVEQGVFETERSALQALFQSASRAKRSKIGSFLPLVRGLDGILRFPEAIGERLGLQAGRAVEADPSVRDALAEALQSASPPTPSEEVALLEAVLSKAASVGFAPKRDAMSPKRVSQTVDRPAVKPDLPQSEPLEIAEGVLLSDGPDGRLILSGDNVDQAFRQQLVSWLQQRG